MCWIQVLCDECPFYNFQIPYRLLVYQVTVRKVTEEIEVGTTMTSPQSLYRLINLMWIDSSGINICDWNLKYVLFGFRAYFRTQGSVSHGITTKLVELFFQKILSGSSSGYWYPPSPAVVLSLIAGALSSSLPLLLLPGSHMPRHFSPSHVLWPRP